MKKGLEFSYPLLSIEESCHDGALPKSFSFVKVDPENIILEAIKQAEESPHLIMRLYETRGKETSAQILFFQSPLEIWETDLLEREISRLPLEGKLLKTDLGAHEIKTLKIKLRQEGLPGAELGT